MQLRQNLEAEVRHRLSEVLQPAHRIAVIRVYDEAGNVIETHKHAGEFKEWYRVVRITSQTRSTRLFWLVAWQTR
jgi:hypothetical protein